MYKTDVCVVGAGPGGCTTALFLAKAGIPSILLDKAIFPRDKICGDGLSGWTVNMLQKIDPALLDRFRRNPISQESWGARFTAPNGQVLDVPFKDKELPGAQAPGYVVPRQEFDYFLLQECRQHPIIKIIEGVEIKATSYGDKDQIFLHGDGQFQLQAKVAIFCNGAQSPQAKSLAGIYPEKKHYVAGVRAYYEGVSGLHVDNYIELHFLKDFLPGYFWIFPLPNGRVNVGAGMRSDKISKGKINLRSEMLRCIAEHPSLQDRFRNARQLSPVRGFGLPLGSRKRQISGRNFMLVGDAASLIDPFTGEGIGNAMASGMMAAIHAQNCLKAGNYSASFMRTYDEAVYNKLWKELRLSKKLQDLLQFPALFSWVVNKATNNKTLRNTISCMLTDMEIREELKNPRFYLKLLFGNH